MRYELSATMLVFTLFSPSGAVCAGRLIPTDVAVGRNLQAGAQVELSHPAPLGGLPIRLASSDPTIVLLSAHPASAGAPSITVTAKEGTRVSPEFYVIGVAAHGVASYTASAPGFENAQAAVRLFPSGFVFVRARAGVPGFRTTTGHPPLDIAVHSVRLDSSLAVAAIQPVAGGRPVTVTVGNSNPAAGKLAPSELVFQPGESGAATHFHPGSPGAARLELKPPLGFALPASAAALAAEVMKPGIAVTTDVAIGRNLQIEAVMSLGEVPPPGGVTVTLVSNSTGRLLLAASPNVAGAERIQLKIPPGTVNARYYLQAIHEEGEVTYTASAPGFVSRTAIVTLTPSGVVIGGPQGPPDEAELLRKGPSEPIGFVTSLAAGHPVPLAVYSVQLDPVTRRGADITVQPLRAGLSMTVRLDNSNPAVGTAPLELTIPGGAYSAASEFIPREVGSTVISVVTPAGFSKSANSAMLTAHVRP